MADETSDAAPSSTAPRASVEVGAPPAVVFEQLLDASSYPSWLVGARRIRSVDPSWPMVGAAFQHVIGGGPIAVPGSTTIVTLREPHELVLSAGMGILGRAVVRFVLEPRGPEGDTTLVSMYEAAAEGPARWAWVGVRPLALLALFGRNALSLAHLRDLVEAQDGAPADGADPQRAEADGDRADRE